MVLIGDLQELGGGFCLVEFVFEEKVEDVFRGLDAIHEGNFWWPEWGGDKLYGNQSKLTCYARSPCPHSSTIVK